MTKEQLRDLIASDEEAANLAKIGDDAGCAKRLSEIAPAVPSTGQKRINGLSLVAAFADPIAGATCWEKLKAAAVGNAVCRVAVDWMGPGSVTGLDIADPRTLAMCDQLVTLGVWTQAEADVVKGMALERPSITAAQVSDALNNSDDRPGGRLK